MQPDHTRLFVCGHTADSHVFVVTMQLLVCSKNVCKIFNCMCGPHVYFLSCIVVYPALKYCTYVHVLWMFIYFRSLERNKILVISRKAFWGSRIESL